MLKILSKVVLVLGLNTKDDETHLRKVSLLTTWCRDNNKNLLLNNSMTTEVVGDFRRGHTRHR